MNKVIKDGMVAVLYTPGYGAGWSTWEHTHKEILCMDERIVQCVLDGDNKKAAEVALGMFPGMYTGGSDDLQVGWVPVGSSFLIKEYDGAESVHIYGPSDYMVA